MTAPSHGAGEGDDAVGCGPDLGARCRAVIEPSVAGAVGPVLDPERIDDGCGHRRLVANALLGPGRTARGHGGGEQNNGQERIKGAVAPP